jgi:DeoR family transcriptional regulator, glycerol-3-phosphate regulon repressor
MKNLKFKERQAKILASLRQHGSLSVAELAALVNVSEETIRRDARQLEETGEVQKLHGALAMPHNMSEAGFERRMRENAQAKIAIARAALPMVRDGESLILDAGSTSIFFARELRQRHGLTVITNSTEIARSLADVPGNNVFLAGGEMDADSGANFGSTAVEFISRFRVKHAFLSVVGLDIEAGPTNRRLKSADIAAAAARCATHRVILADSSKFGVQAFARICSYENIEVVVTEKVPAPEFFATFNTTGTRLVVATA